MAIDALLDTRKRKFLESTPFLIYLIFRGGFAVVWLAKQIQTGEMVALKQINTKNSRGTHKRELRIAKKWFDDNGQLFEDIKNHPGVE